MPRWLAPAAPACGRQLAARLAWLGCCFRPLLSAVQALCPYGQLQVVSAQPVPAWAEWLVTLALLHVGRQRLCCWSSELPAIFCGRWQQEALRFAVCSVRWLSAEASALHCCWLGLQASHVDLAVVCQMHPLRRSWTSH